MATSVSISYTGKQTSENQNVQVITNYSHVYCASTWCILQVELWRCIYLIQWDISHIDSRWTTVRYFTKNLFPERCELKEVIWLTEWTCIDAPESQTLGHNSSWVNHLFLKEDQRHFTHYIVWSTIVECFVQVATGCDWCVWSGQPQWLATIIVQQFMIENLQSISLCASLDQGSLMTTVNLKISIRVSAILVTCYAKFNYDWPPTIIIVYNSN